MNDHDHGHDHDHHQHALSWEDELAQLRDAASEYYAHEFDWRGHGPPKGFAGPRFYPPAAEWRLAARLDADVPGAGDHAEIATSTGQLRHMHVAGQLVFDVAGAELRLTAFVSQDPNGEEVLFVPFRDATSGSETYGAGRYVEVYLADGDDDGPLELDFNLAYNPSCVFSPAYDCPYPPPANRLSVAVRAGEMLPLGLDH